MFETLELQNLKKLIEGEVRDFASPEAFHTLKVERLGGNPVKPSAEICSKFPMPIFALVGYFVIKPCQHSDGTPPVARPFNFTRKVFVEGSELFQGLFQRLWMRYLLAGVEREKGVVFDTEVCAYTFTRSGQDFLSGIVSDDIKPKRSNRVAKDLNIANFTVPISVVVEREPTFIKLKILLIFVPHFERETHTSCFKFVPCLELCGAVTLFAFELWHTDTSAFLTSFEPSEKAFPSDMQSDNHSVKCVARNPCPVLLGTFQ